MQQTTDDLARLEQEILDEVTAIDDKWKTAGETIDTVAIRLEATDVRVTDVRLVWVPVSSTRAPRPRHRRLWGSPRNDGELQRVGSRGRRRRLRQRR